MTEKLYHYSIVRYVPAPTRGEFVNIGVLVVSDDGADAGADFTSDWKRARSLGDAGDLPGLQKLSKHWKKTARSALAKGELFDTFGGLDLLTKLSDESSNTVQLSTPRAVFGQSATSVVHELFDELVDTPRRAKAHRSGSRRGLQLRFEAQIRHLGLQGAVERDFQVRGDLVKEWVFDYALRNGRPQHFIQTLNLNASDVTKVLSEVTYVAYAHRDLRADNVFADVPITVIAAPRLDNSDSFNEEAHAILTEAEVALVSPEDVPGFVERLSLVFGR